jgi:hypothetical protein
MSIAVLGKNGSGKTYAAKGAIVERLLEDGRRVGIVDPTGAWWGLRTSRDGKGAGFPMLVLGGDHGDLPLPPNGGAAVARLLAVQGVNLVADTSQMTVGERTRWFTEFASTLYRSNKTPLHLVIDEAHNFAPQGKVPDPDAGKMLHAASTLASQGRSRGIRLTMITQRPQKLHKDSLTSADALIAMRVIHPLDRGAVADWINGCGDPAKGKEVLESLANLQRGEGWAWYPEGGFLQRMKFPPIKTFDSSATPMDGEPIAVPKGAAEIDLTEIRAALADAVKEAEANDPKLLRAEIAKLRKLAELRATSLHEPDPGALDAARAEGYESGKQTGRAIALENVVRTLEPFVTSIREELKEKPAKPAPPQPRLVERSRAMKAVVDRGPVARAKPGAAEGITGPQQRILDALAWWESTGVMRASRIQVGAVAGYTASGGSFRNQLGALRTAGLIDYPSDGEVTLTDAGRALAQQPDAPATTEDLHARVLAVLTGAQRKLLQPLLAHYPERMSREGLANYVGLEAAGGGFRNTLGSLRSLGFIEYPTQGSVAASAMLFLHG